jgi:hypothetical protein
MKIRAVVLKSYLSYIELRVHLGGFEIGCVSQSNSFTSSFTYIYIYICAMLSPFI